MEAGISEFPVGPRWLRLSCLCATAIVLDACSGSTSPGAAAPQRAVAGRSLRVSILNYADQGIRASFDGQYSRQPGAFDEGVALYCCPGLSSVTWYPGLAVELTYQTDAMFRADHALTRTVSLPVEPFDNVVKSDLWLLYYPDGSFKVYLAGHSLGLSRRSSDWVFPDPVVAPVRRSSMGPGSARFRQTLRLFPKLHRRQKS
jgi:hypothetical protein